MNETILSQSLFYFPPTSSYLRHYTEEEITSLVMAIHSLKNDVKEIMINQAINSLQLPSEMVEPAVDSYMKRTYKLGRPPMEAEIKDAITKTKTMKAAGDYLGISTTTLKRYCSLYEKNSEGGTTPLRLWQPTRGTRTYKSVLP